MAFSLLKGCNAVLSTKFQNVFGGGTARGHFLLSRIQRKEPAPRTLTLELIAGPSSSAPGFASQKALAEILDKLDEESLSQLVRDKGTAAPSLFRPYP